MSRPSREAWQDIVVAASFLVVASLLVWHARTFGQQARMLPLAVGVPLLGLSALNLVTVASRGLRGIPPVDTAAAPDAAGPAYAQAGGPGAQQAVTATATEPGLGLPWVMLVLGSLLAVFGLFGFVISALVYPVGVMRLYGKHSWSRSVLVAVVTCLALYGASEALDIPLFDGWLFLEGILPALPF